MKALVIEDQFPKESKLKIEEETGVEINLIEDYQGALDKIGGDLSEYDLVITDIGLPDRKTDRGPLDPAALFNAIFEDLESIEDQEKKAYEVLQCWKRLGYKLDPNDEDEIVAPSSFTNLSDQRGLLVAGILQKKGIPFTVFTSDIGHAQPALSLLAGGGILTTPDIKNIEEADEKGALGVSLSRRLTVGDKRDPQTWITLFQMLS